MEDFHNLLILMVVIWVMGKLFRMMSLPVIFGELLGGILVGPHLLGLVDPASVSIKVLAELGVFFLMLHSGLETDPHELFKGSKKSIFVAVGGLIGTFTAGFFTSQFLDFTFMQSLFIATVTSATSIAIAMRILKDCKIQNTQFGHTILGAAVLSDLVILIAFSAILELSQTGNVDIMSLGLLLAKVIGFFAIVIFLGLKLQPYTKNFFKNKGFSSTLILALLLGLFAEWIGLHAIIGAFLAGLFIREELLVGKVFNKIEDRVYGLSYSFLGPIFFTTLAFNLDFKGIIDNPVIFISLFMAAFFGKLIGSGLGSLSLKTKPMKALLTGLTMNSRGALDLIIISLGLKAGIIDQQTFSILVAIAFSATLISIIAMKPIKKRTKFKY